MPPAIDADSENAVEASFNEDAFNSELQMQQCDLQSEVSEFDFIDSSELENPF